MRFILNFFLFGILFYLIYVFFPDAFHTLVSWADTVYNFFRDIILGIKEKVGTQPAEHSSSTGTVAMMVSCLSLLNKN